MKTPLLLLVGWYSFGGSSGLSQDNHPHSWQFGLADVRSDKGCSECGLNCDCPECKCEKGEAWQFSLPPADKPLEYTVAYNAVVKAETGKKRCLLVVGLTKEQREIASGLAKEKGFLFSVASSLEEVPAGMYLLTKIAEGKGVLTPYPTESKPVLAVECIDGKCRLVH